MRQKDAVAVANVLGRSLRFADESEIDGLLVAAAEVAGHCEHAYPQIDVDKYWAAFRRATHGQAFTPEGEKS